MPSLEMKAAEYVDPKSELPIQGKTPDEIFYEYGPLVNVEVRAESENDNPGSLVASGYALLDTGAGKTSIMHSIIGQINAHHVGQETEWGAFTDAVQVQTFQVYVKLIDLDLEYSSHASSLNITRLLNKGIIAIIGRDLLQHCILNLNGPNASFTLSYPDSPPDFQNLENLDHLELP